METANKQQILIIDDEPANIRLITEYLRDYGFSLLIAVDGEDGVRIARETLPNLVLLDVRMPGMDGFEACRQLKSDPATRDIPVVFLSALSSTEAVVQGFEVGGVDYITKPARREEVVARVIAHLNQVNLIRSLKGRLEQYDDLDVRQSAEEGEAEPQLPEVRVRRLQKVRDHLLAHLQTTPSLDELARIGITNRTQLNRDFKVLFGTTVYDWLREERLNQSMKLLSTTDAQIQVVARQVGYNNAAAFSVAFRQRYGITPREFRTRRQGS